MHGPFLVVMKFFEEFEHYLLKHGEEIPEVE